MVGGRTEDKIACCLEDLSKSARAEAARVLRRVLEAIGRGELTAPAGMVRRLEGATAALAPYRTGSMLYVVPMSPLRRSLASP